MQSSSFHQLPPFFLVLAAVLAVVVFILQIGILGYAYEKMGISRTAAYAILLLSLLGSSINIPLAELPGEQQMDLRIVRDGWGVRYAVPVMQEWPGTVLTINVGGALIPTLLSIYLVVKNRIGPQSLAGVALVAGVVFLLAEPVEQMGIAVPMFVPPIVSAVVAVMLSREHAAPLAYVSGCMGTLVGADVLNLGVINRLGASIVSIGGAGTFDAVFLSGVLAVLLAGIGGRPVASEPATSESGETNLDEWEKSAR